MVQEYLKINSPLAKRYRFLINVNKIMIGFQVVQEYERAVIFRLGRVLPGARGPGMFFIIPCMDSLVKKDLRTISFDVPPQEVKLFGDVTQKGP